MICLGGKLKIKLGLSNFKILSVSLVFLKVIYANQREDLEAKGGQNVKKPIFSRIYWAQEY